MYDFCIVGGGIVGLATAMAVLETRPGARLVLVEKEDALGSHQTGHNSGVIHAGVYYAPGSLKATLCREGEVATKRFCTEHGIPFAVPGKLIVATDRMELDRLGALETNARKNGIALRRVDGGELRELEPGIVGLGALLVEASGIVDYGAVARAMGAVIAKQGGQIVRSARVDRIEERGDHVRVVAGGQAWEARHAIACAGLQADRLAAASGVDIDFRIVPFRGEYYAVRPEKRALVRRMIYPVPDPALPFLGIHLTPMIDGSLTVGPNAVLALAREGYEKLALDIADVASFARFPGFWRLIGRNLRSGLGEMKDSAFKASYLEKCHKYCPSLELDDLLPYRAGIRAQAVMRDGTMVHDFLFRKSGNVLHVCNAPSPAATSAIPIGRMIAGKFD
ncbi:L-2-hydroxyglutarate oxidase [Mesorhizobium sp. CAU 1741]|uniref:L-2-hydroxyglutarate oxidase n=1 Tax=Mesorhizobium sp. CAU 1741 TaxID=3140366 RepID=UPI00325A9661